MTRDWLSRSSTRSGARAVVTPLRISTRSLRTRRDNETFHRTEQSTSTIIATRNASTSVIFNHNLLDPSAGVETTAITVRIDAVTKRAVHWAAGVWRQAFKNLLTIGTRGSTSISWSESSCVFDDSSIRTACIGNINTINQLGTVILPR